VPGFGVVALECLLESPCADSGIGALSLLGSKILYSHLGLGSKPPCDS
jgi:hypothetical protein